MEPARDGIKERAVPKWRVDGSDRIGLRADLGGRGGGLPPARRRR